MKKVCVYGASGYAGLELMRLLAGHPEMEPTKVISRQFAGKKVGDVFGSLDGVIDLPFSPADPAEAVDGADLVFTAVPHGAAMELVPQLLDLGAKVVDFSSDFRLKDPQAYQALTGHPHTNPELLAKAVFGLTEFYRPQVKAADLIANPGCYVTSALFALLPLLGNNLIEPNGIIVNSASGVSGAGRSAKVHLLESEIHEDFKAYAATFHRHCPEIEQELGLAAGRGIKITFTPHLLPMVRGILSTIYVRPQAGLTASDLIACWQDQYDHEPFVTVMTGDLLPATKMVRGTNRIALGLAVDKGTGVVKIFSALDNLTKGAAGQALQNANLMLGLDETLGLPLGGVYP